MALFRRKDKRSARDSEPTRSGDADDELTGEELTGEEEPSGPRDSEGELCPAGYIDLGALYVPAEPGVQIRAQFEGEKKALRRILLVAGNSGIQFSVAAAPRSGGVWDELRDQLSAGIKQMNGTTDEVETRYGTELDAKVPVRLPDGGEGRQPLRMIGIEGPRWLLRVDLQGAAATGDPEQRELCERIIDRVIVNRGSEPRIRLELLPLTLPVKPKTSATGETQPDARVAGKDSAGSDSGANRGGKKPE